MTYVAELRGWLEARGHAIAFDNTVDGHAAAAVLGVTEQYLRRDRCYYRRIPSRRVMSAPITPSEILAEQVAIDTARMLAELESAGHTVTPLVQCLVEMLMRTLYERGVEKALAEHLPHLAASGSHH